jgi:hypothetical protein
MTKPTPKPRTTISTLRKRIVELEAQLRQTEEEYLRLSQDFAVERQRSADEFAQCVRLIKVVAGLEMRLVQATLVMPKDQKPVRGMSAWLPDAMLKARDE